MAIRCLFTCGVVGWKFVKRCELHGANHCSDEHFRITPVKKKSIIQSTNTTGFPVVRHGNGMLQLPTNRDRAIAGGIEELALSDE
jgi:hypothetical protein